MKLFFVLRQIASPSKEMPAHPVREKPYVCISDHLPANNTTTLALRAVLFCGEAIRNTTTYGLSRPDLAGISFEAQAI